ncbi:ethanolamine kinase [Bactrocera oleae]|uniref:ethanolamine kinase n=1 Tax=Bactrocera oleae TaxID=104688 RepID=UPI00387E24E7
MGTETKFNSYKENTTSTTGSVFRPKVAHNGTSAAALGAGVGQKLHSSNGALNSKQQQHSDITNGSCVTPVFVPIHIGDDVISGAKEVLNAIRPQWNISHVQFKKFTDGITNKLVGCFYNPPQTNTTTITNNSNGNEIDTGSAYGNDTPNSPPTLASSTLLDDNNDSGNISDTDTLDSEVTMSSALDIDNSHNASNTVNTKAESQNSIPINESNVALVRVYGNKTDLLIDRKAETRNIQLLHTYGFAPTLFATFKNGLVYDFVPGVTLKPTSVLEPSVWRLVATRMAEMHRRVQVQETPADAACGAAGVVPMLWHKTQSFFNLVPERFSDPEKHKRVEETFLPIKRLRDEFNALYRRLERLGSPVVFAHNDLLLANIVYLEAEQCVNFIDYEYADYNFQAFDIGNHFCEFAGVDEADFSRYPKRDFQLAWLRVYLQEYLQRSEITDAEVERLYLQVNQFALAAHMLWTIWSLIQAEHSNIDFDYVEYAHIRYAEYKKHKSIIGLRTTEEDDAATENNIAAQS